MSLGAIGCPNQHQEDQSKQMREGHWLFPNSGIVKRKFMNTVTPKAVSSTDFAGVLANPNLQSHFWLGVDGGGTNCRAVIADDAGKTLGEGQAEAANFLRVGLEKAVSHV